MSNTELPQKLWGRKVRPYAFAVSLSTAVIVKGLLWDMEGPGTKLDGTLTGALVGAVGLWAVIALWIAFWARSDVMMKTGLLLTAGVWSARWFFVGMDESFLSQSALLSMCWVVASSGAYLLEETTGEGTRFWRRRE